MATATVRTAPTTVKVEKEVQVPDGCTLTLSLEESVFLRGLLGNCGAEGAVSPVKTAWKVSCAIYRALEGYEGLALTPEHARGNHATATLLFSEASLTAVEAAAKKLRDAA